MTISSSTRRLFGALVAAVAMSVASLSAQQMAQSRIIQRVIVKVNGEALTQTDLEERQVDALRERYPQLRDVRNVTDETLRQRLAEVTPAILNAAVDELLLVQRGRELGYSMSDDQFNRYVENFKKENQLDDARLKEALQTEGITVPEWRAMLERQVMIQGVQQREIMGKTTLTESEMRSYYEANRDKFMKPATVTLREIFVAVPTESRAGQTGVIAATEEAAKAKIDAARERLVKGEDIAAVVAEVSESGSKANGGLVGPVSLAEIDPTLKAGLENLKVGEVSQPLRTARGYVLFKMDSRTEAEPRPFVDVRDEVYQEIMGTRVDGETRKYLDAIRGTAVIEWKDEAMKKLYEQSRAGKTGDRP